MKPAVVVLTVALALGGCGTLSLSLKTEATPPAQDTAVTASTAIPLETIGDETLLPAPADVAVVPAADVEPRDEGGADSPAALTEQAADASLAQDTEDVYDPWESFNEKMFNVNRNLDRYVLKPAARAYKAVMPEPFQVLIDNAFTNLRWVPRFINSLLQGKFDGAGREMGRFVINSTAGVGGLFDPAKDYWGIRPSKEDFGQTLGVWGSGPGPYLILPLLPPMTVRDGIGMGVDGAMDPLSYFLPFIWDRLGMKLGDTLNDRALNYDLFQGVEETTIDLYSSVRHFYLKRREQQIKE